MLESDSFELLLLEFELELLELELSLPELESLELLFESELLVLELLLVFESLDPAKPDKLSVEPELLDESLPDEEELSELEEELLSLPLPLFDSASES